MASTKEGEGRDFSERADYAAFEDQPKNDFRTSPLASCRWDGVWELAAVVVKPSSADTRPAGRKDRSINAEVVFRLLLSTLFRPIFAAAREDGGQPIPARLSGANSACRENRGTYRCLFCRSRVRSTLGPARLVQANTLPMNPRNASFPPDRVSPIQRSHRMVFSQNAHPRRWEERWVGSGGTGQ